MEQILIKDEKYYGQYVIIEDFDKPNVIASGTDMKKVYEEATKKGYKNPVIVYIPKKDMVHIYTANKI